MGHNTSKTAEVLTTFSAVSSVLQSTHVCLCLFLLLLNPADEGSELSSGRDTPASSSSRQGLADQTEEKTKKEKKKKEKTKKKEKNKGKGKEKEKKKAEETEETEKKGKKIGFGLLR